VAATLTFTVLLAVKSLPEAKSRLRRMSEGVGGELDDGTHSNLVRAMRADTIAAVREAGYVDHVVIIGDQPDPEYTLVQSAPGLNAALDEAAAYARSHWPDTAVAALVADLPAVRAADLDSVLGQAEQMARGFVPDYTGTGTTLLTAAPGRSLLPAFGRGSAARHALIATAIDADPRLRHDVDTWADLQACLVLGLAPHSAAAYSEFISQRHDIGHDELLPGH
jgi:2-phospho-L-lactate guanylyltransferase